MDVNAATPSISRRSKLYLSPDILPHTLLLAFTEKAREIPWRPKLHEIRFEEEEDEGGKGGRDTWRQGGETRKKEKEQTDEEQKEEEGEE